MYSPFDYLILESILTLNIFCHFSFGVSFSVKTQRLNYQQPQRMLCLVHLHLRSTVILTSNLKNYAALLDQLVTKNWPLWLFTLFKTFYMKREQTRLPLLFLNYKNKSSNLFFLEMSAVFWFLTIFFCFLIVGILCSFFFSVVFQQILKCTLLCRFFFGKTT